ncbi:MAG: HigA family addiction module antidote protein [Deltaproteobacteria bacterium]|nr:HigA family addiction module antidote protein [Deltaproteobacteria bacterium]
MLEKKRKPTHPGGILKRHYLEPLHVSVSELAKVLKISRSTISKLVNEQGHISTDIALRLSAALKTTPQLWLNLQQNYDLWQAQKNLKDLKSIHPIAA